MFTFTLGKLGKNFIRIILIVISILTSLYFGKEFIDKYNENKKMIHYYEILIKDIKKKNENLRLENEKLKNQYKNLYEKIEEGNKNIKKYISRYNQIKTEKELLEDKLNEILTRLRYYEKLLKTSDKKCFEKEEILKHIYIILNLPVKIEKEKKKENIINFIKDKEIKKFIEENSWLEITK